MTRQQAAAVAQLEASLAEIVAELSRLQRVADEAQLAPVGDELSSCRHQVATVWAEVRMGQTA